MRDHLLTTGRLLLAQESAPAPERRWDRLLDDDGGSTAAA
jgi:hypothetical protein